jgi:hypothetical protein
LVVNYRKQLCSLYGKRKGERIERRKEKTKPEYSGSRPGAQILTTGWDTHLRNWQLNYRQLQKLASKSPNAQTIWFWDDSKIQKKKKFFFLFQNSKSQVEGMIG